MKYKQEIVNRLLVSFSCILHITISGFAKMLRSRVIAIGLLTWNAIVSLFRTVGSKTCPWWECCYSTQ